jgi:hypothetical protein
MGVTAMFWMCVFLNWTACEVRRRKACEAAVVSSPNKVQVGEAMT